MALPTSGQLSYSEIYAEIYGSHTTQQCSMFAMATAASLPTSNASVSQFYGYSQGENVVASWSTTYSPNPLSSTSFGIARIIALTGLDTSTIRPRVTVSLSTCSSATFNMHWSTTSSSGPWTSAGSTSSPGTTYYYLPHNTYVSSAQTLYARQFISKSPSGSVVGSITLTNTYQYSTGPPDSFTGSGSWGISI